MTPETFASWLTRQGYRVTRSRSSYWYNAGPKVLQAFPYHWLIQPDREEIQMLLVDQGNLALRYSCPLGTHPGMASYHVVLTPPYSMETLRSQARNGIRRGLEHCSVAQVGLERLANEGWTLQQDTLQRQNRSKSMRKEEWELLCHSATGLPGFEAWAAIVEGELAACLLVARTGDVYCVPYAVCHHKFLNLHVNNALFFTVSNELLSRPDIRELFFSLHSLDAPESVNEFKFRMGLQARPVCQRVALHPILEPLANGLTLSIFQKLLRLNGDMPFISKLEGMLRFYRNGILPLEQQVWPECIADRKPAFPGEQVSMGADTAISAVEGIE